VASDVIVPEMEFCLLGPLVVRRLGAIIPVPVGKQRAVLAALLLDADRVLRLDELAEALWGPSPPPSARVTVQNHIMRLRHALGDSGRARIRTQPGGYSIEVGTGELDVARFESLLGGARAAARDGRWAMVTRALAPPRPMMCAPSSDHNSPFQTALTAQFARSPL